MRKKIAMIVLSLVMATSFSLFFAACSGKKPDPTPVHEHDWETTWTYDETYHWHKCKDATCDEITDRAEHSYTEGVCICGHIDPDYVENVEVIGFDVQSGVVVTTGTKVVLEKPQPVNQHGTSLNVYFDVIDATGGHVATFTDLSGNEYFIAKGTGYTISYVVYPQDKVVTLKTTTVTVVGEATVTVKYDSVVEVGDEIMIVPDCGFYNPEFEYSVRKENGDAVTVTNAKFTADTVGFYDVSVTATAMDKTAETSYRIYARNLKSEGEVETFYSDWETLRSVNGFNTRGWAITDTATCGIKNYKNEDDTYIFYSAKSNQTSIPYYLDALYSQEEYLAMVAEGYTRLTFKVYIQGENLHGLRYNTDLLVNGSLTITLDDLVPNMWNTVNIYFSHQSSSACLDRNFLCGYVLWESQEVQFIDIMNSSSENFVIYIDDIFATKDATPTENTAAVKDFSTGNTYDLTQLVNGTPGVDYTYLIKNNTAKEEYSKVEDPSAYKFLSSGNYKIKVIPSQYNFRGENEFSFEVTDGITVKKAWNKVKMTGDSITINFADLDAVLMNEANEITTEVTGVYFHDDYKLSSTSTSVSIDKAGYYKIYLEGTYGDGYKTFKSVDLDVYTAETEFMMAKAEDFVATRYWAYTNLPKTEVGVYEIEGQQVNAFKVTKLAGIAVMFRPMFSKMYYEEMATEYDAVVSFNAYYMGTGTCYTRVMPSKTDTNNYNKWNSDEINLSWFIGNYEKIEEGYNEVYANYLNNGNPTIAFGNLFNGGTGINEKYKSYIYMINSNNSSKTDMYIMDLSIQAMFVDETEYLVNVNGMSGTTYDITQSFGVKGQKALDMYSGETLTYSLTDERGTTLSSRFIDITQQQNLRKWTIEILKGTSIVYRGIIDLYDSTAAIVWDDDVTGAGTWAFYGMGGKIYALGSGEAATLTRGSETLNMIKLDSSNYKTTSDIYATVKPIHTKSYYQLFAGENIKLSFSAYFDVDADTIGFAQLFIAGRAGTVSYDKGINGWFDLEISLSKLLDNWKYVSFDGEIYSWGTRLNKGMMYLYNPQNETTTNHAIYMGNFKVIEG